MDILKLDHFENIYAVKNFQKEFVNITKEKMADSPPYPQFQRWLIRSLTKLDQMGRLAVTLDGFEKLDSKNPELFSIRYPHSKLNPRVIYACFEGSKIILLTAFKEENAKSDYKTAMNRAKKRYKALEND